MIGSRSQGDRRFWQNNFEQTVPWDSPPGQKINGKLTHSHPNP
ncbi:MAG TPA: hypothetical protein V6D27_04985 [Vampirovibrionales bacterium]